MRCVGALQPRRDRHLRAFRGSLQTQLPLRRFSFRKASGRLWRKVEKSDRRTRAPNLESYSRSRSIVSAKNP